MCRLPVAQRVGLKACVVFLTNNELQQLTGYQKPTLQRRWLVDNGYSFDVRRDGKPVVSRCHYESHHGVVVGKRPSAPDLDALDKLD
jgi:hypothetical protein